MMFHDPNTDHFKATTNELICAIVNRIDTPDCLHSLLGLMVGMSDRLPINKQYHMAATLSDAALMIVERPEVRDWVDRLKEAST